MEGRPVPSWIPSPSSVPPTSGNEASVRGRVSRAGRRSEGVLSNETWERKRSNEEFERNVGNASPSHGSSCVPFQRRTKEPTSWNEKGGRMEIDGHVRLTCDPTFLFSSLLVSKPRLMEFRMATRILEGIQTIPCSERQGLRWVPRTWMRLHRLLKEPWPCMEIA